MWLRSVNEKRVRREERKKRLLIVRYSFWHYWSEALSFPFLSSLNFFSLFSSLFAFSIFLLFLSFWAVVFSQVLFQLYKNQKTRVYQQTKTLKICTKLLSFRRFLLQPIFSWRNFLIWKIIRKSYLKEIPT